MKKTERILKLITDSAACEHCNTKVYWIRTKDTMKIPINPDGTLHVQTCPKGDRYAKSIQDYRGSDGCN